MHDFNLNKSHISDCFVCTVVSRGGWFDPKIGSIDSDFLCPRPPPLLCAVALVIHDSVVLSHTEVMQSYFSVGNENTTILFIIQIIF